MKKISTLFASFLIGCFAFGQSQRLVLVEEFTQASCGPCAAQNPGFNTLLAANPTKAISVKYQTSWPGVDPMNAQTQTWVAPRVTYYNVTGVPHGTMDGTDIVNDCSAYTGAPACLSQSEIDAEYAVPSPFTMSATHTFNTAMDSVFITIVITCSQNVTMTTGKLYVAMVEDMIKFATPPGSNGEKEFFGVMRRMYPDGNGTVIANGWTVSQTQTLNFNVAIPTYVYNKGQIAIHAWIQDDANKNTKQAARSAPVPMPNDAGISVIAGVSAGSCNTTFTPTVTIKNYGTMTLTACNILYRIDAAAPTTLPWTGSLAPNATTTVTLPLQTTTMGGHTFSAWTTSPNSGTDYNAINDNTTQAYIVLSSTSVNAPLIEGYVAATFPPVGWIRDNPDAGPTWTRVTNCGGFGNSANAAKVDFYNSGSGNNDYLYAPPVDMSAALSPAELKFDVAYAPYDATYIDTLEVEVTTDCGATWTSVYQKWYTVLATAPATTAAFTPTAAQWRAEIVSLNAFMGQNDVVVRFAGRSGYGNNCYIDNINITYAGAGIQEIGNIATFNVYPNPFSGIATFNIGLSKADNVVIKVTNVVGNVVSNYNAGMMNAGANLVNFDGSVLSSGFYFVTVSAGSQTITQKISVNK